MSWTAGSSPAGIAAAHEPRHRVTCTEAVPVASFHWGHPPRAWIDALHSAGVQVWERVASADAAKRAVDDGADLVIAQGSEAGGHNLGTLPAMTLLPLVADAVAPALVLAAGGIADDRGLAAALMLGADGVWVGTRLVATAESGAHQDYKARLAGAQATDTVLTHVFGRDMPSSIRCGCCATGSSRSDTSGWTRFRRHQQ